MMRCRLSEKDAKCKINVTICIDIRATVHALLFVHHGQHRPRTRMPSNWAATKARPGSFTASANSWSLTSRPPNVSLSELMKPSSEPLPYWMANWVLFAALRERCGQLVSMMSVPLPRVLLQLTRVWPAHLIG